MGGAAHGIEGSSSASTPRKKSAISRRKSCRSRSARTYSFAVIFSEPRSAPEPQPRMPSDSSRRRAGGTPQTPAPRSAGTIPSGASPARSERFPPSLPDPTSPGRPSRRLAQPRRPPRRSDKGPGRGQDGGLGCRAPSQPHNRGSARRAKRVARIVARERLQNERGVARCSGHGAQVIEGLHVWADADEARPSVRRLEADDAAEGGGISDGSSRIRAESERAQPRRDGCCGAPADPPVMRSSFQGFRAVPKWGLMVVGAAANSWVSVLPSMTAPARRRRAMHSASSDGTWFRKKLDPFVVRTPVVSMMSFIP